MNKDKDEIALLSEIIDTQKRAIVSLTEIVDTQKRSIISLRTSNKLLDARVSQDEENIKILFKHINTLSFNDQTLSSNIATVQNDSALELNKLRNELKNDISPGQEPKKIVRVNSRARF